MSKKTKRSQPAKRRADAHQHTDSESSVPCVECKKEIVEREQALFVEEEVGRYFCSEACIVAYFTPEIEKLEREYGRNVSAHDLSPEEREKYAHLRWMTLEDPNEVWRTKSSQGDYRYTLINEYHPDQKTVYGVAVCLMLRGDPSFLYLAFVTSDASLVDVFRKGERAKMAEKENAAPKAVPREEEVRAAGLADAWTEADSVHATILKARKQEDISTDDFGFYQRCLEETLKEPNELWSYYPKSAARVYHFLKKYSHDKDFWYVVIAKDTTDETQIEIVDAFPTRDDGLVQLCRHGKKEKLQGAGLSTDTSAQDEEDLPMAAGAEQKGRRNIH